MGALIPIGEGADAEIKDLLNKTFHDVNLDTLQNLYAAEHLFDANHTLHRVAYRLGCHPKKKYFEPSRAKWFYFLQTVLPAAMNSGVSTSNAIKYALDYAQNPANNIERVVFDAIENSAAAAHHLHPDNAPGSVPGMVQGRSLKLVLICPAPLNPANVASDPTTPDTNAAGVSVETNSPLP